MLAPAGTPPQIADKIVQVFEAVLKDPRVVKYHDELGATLMKDIGPQATREFHDSRDREDGAFAIRVAVESGVMP